MELLLDRKYKKDEYTIGLIYVNGSFFCNIIEDKDRGLRQDMSLEEIFKIKVKGKTAIPTGRYRVRVTWSPRFRCMMPIVCDVPGYEGIRFHAGNTAKDTDGCLCAGMNKKKGMVLDSRKWNNALTKKIKDAIDKRKEEVWITIR